MRDNGIGVPAHERPHLFMKFYRAANARKARPDGARVSGLYMAKKVICSRRHHIVFESKEGQGRSLLLFVNQNPLFEGFMGGAAAAVCF